MPEMRPDRDPSRPIPARPPPGNDGARFPWGFRGEQTSLKRTVAVKVLPPRLAEEEKFIARFHREADALARLNHPNIVSVIDRGRTDDGRYYILMEYVSGRTLEALLRSGPLDPDTAVDYMRQLAEALRHAHARGIVHRDLKPANIIIQEDGRLGIVHRDLKPANIIIQEDGRLRVLDFGIAQIARGAQEWGKVTATGVALGTPAYMAPEQKIDAGRVDHRADIYALGAIVYEMFTGRAPIGAYAPPSSAAPGLPFDLDAVLNRALAYAPEERYASVEQFLAEFEKTATRPAHARPARARARTGERLAVAGAGVLALALVLFFALRGTRPARRQASTPIARSGPSAGVQPSKAGPEAPPTGEPATPPTSQPPKGPEPAPPPTPPDGETRSAPAPPTGPPQTPPAVPPVALSREIIIERLRRPLSVQFEQTPLTEALRFLAVAVKVPVNLAADARDSGGDLITMNVRGMRGDRLLDELARRNGLHVVVTDGAVWLRKRTSLTTRYYEVADILSGMEGRGEGRGARALTEAIVQGTGMQDISTKGGKILVLGGRIQLTAPEPTQRKVAEMLAQLRKEYATKVSLTLTLPKPVGETLRLTVLNGVEGSTRLQRASPALRRGTRGRGVIVPTVEVANNAVHFSARPTVRADGKTIRIAVDIQVAWTQMKEVHGGGTTVSLPNTFQWASRTVVDVPNGGSVEIISTTGKRWPVGRVRLSAVIVPTTGAARTSAPPR